MASDIDHDRRRFLGRAAMTIAAAQARHVNQRVAPRRGQLEMELGRSLRSLAA